MQVQDFFSWVVGGGGVAVITDSTIKFLSTSQKATKKKSDKSKILFRGRGVGGSLITTSLSADC